MCQMGPGGGTGLTGRPVNYQRHPRKCRNDPPPDSQAFISLFHCQKEVKHLFRESQGRSTKPQPKLENGRVVRILGFEPRHSGSDMLKLFGCGEGPGCG